MKIEDIVKAIEEKSKRISSLNNQVYNENKQLSNLHLNMLEALYGITKGNIVKSGELIAIVEYVENYYLTITGEYILSVRVSKIKKNGEIAKVGTEVRANCLTKLYDNYEEYKRNLNS